ncbi:FecR family protein [Thauera linaloolentis]|uniref:FecR family protein n=1 Tax=Thauera linaloolentis (strain DSM 12138 / JCM 21573 / CCUG 41526 / CIP 105981 / IAM 15112 / NBRC 102519 / 47Lol) TaxID=1123367 RepID=N6Z1H4_THAL4|nr:FecR family protein [Thauera linaloolentis]ENO86024.1 FecR family protein [Thauera linaloolentis 47Lol = DSM 12138]MCM8567388.1 FecR family protein [Thauera linaloolentis]
MTPLAPNVQLHEAAAEWFLRRSETPWTPADETAFAEWLAADPAHQQVYASLARTWDDFSSVQRPALAADSAAETSDISAGQAASTPRSAPNPRRRWFQGLFGGLSIPTAATACLTLVVGGWLAWNNIPRYSVELATAHGQTERFDLPDGSSAVLNMDSQVQVRYYPGRRTVQLSRGEAFFRVEAGPERPFTVRTGNSEVRVIGTAFNVRAIPPGLSVKVLEGQVEVRIDTSSKQAPVRLAARQGLLFDPVGMRYQTTALLAETVGDWRDGQLIFRRSRLAEVAEELGRYLGQPVELRGKGIADLRVSGYAATQAPQAFLESLPDLLPVRVQKRNDGTYVIVSR